MTGIIGFLVPLSIYVVNIFILSIAMIVKTVAAGKRIGGEGIFLRKIEGNFQFLNLFATHDGHHFARHYERRGLNYMFSDFDVPIICKLSLDVVSDDGRTFENLSHFLAISRSVFREGQPSILWRLSVESV